MLRVVSFSPRQGVSVASRTFLQPGQVRFGADAPPSVTEGFTNLKKKLERQAFLEKHERLQKEFLILPGGNNKLTGLQFLQLVRETQRFKIADEQTAINRYFFGGIILLTAGFPFLFPGIAKGYALNWLPNCTPDDLHGVVNPTKQYEDSMKSSIQSALDKLEKEGCLYQDEKIYRITREGRKILAYNRDLGVKGKELPLQENLSPKTDTDVSVLERIKVLTMAAVNQPTGWEILSQLNRHQAGRSGISTFFSPGIAESRLLKLIGPANGETVQHQLQALLRLGYLDKSLKKDEVHWTLSDSAKGLLKFPDAQSAFQLTDEMTRKLFNTEIERLESTRQLLDQSLQTLETECKQMQEEVVKRQGEMNQARQDALKVYGLYEKTSDETERSRLQLQATEHANRFEELKAMDGLEREWLGNTRQQLEKARLFHRRTALQIQQGIGRLKQALSQEKILQVFNNFAFFMNQLQTLEEQQKAGSAGLNALILDLTASVQTKLLNVQAGLQVPEDPTAVAAEKLFQQQSFEEQMAALKGETKETLAVGKAVDPIFDKLQNPPAVKSETAH